MPTSSSAGSCCTRCRTASTASATTASSPIGLAATASLSVIGCWMPVTPVPASLPTTALNAIVRSPRATSPSVPIAAAPCGGSQPCRAPATLSHSSVTRHDRPADAYRDRTRPQCCGSQCLHGHRAADQPLPPGIQPVPARELDAIAAHALKRRYKPPSTPARQPTPNHYPHQASVTIPIAPKFPRLRSIRLL